MIEWPIVISMTWWFFYNMLISYEKHEIHITCSNEKACIDDCVLKCKNLCEKANETQIKKDLVSIQGFYNPNVSISLLVEHVYYHTDILSGKIK